MYIAYFNRSQHALMGIGTGDCIFVVHKDACQQVHGRYIL